MSAIDVNGVRSAVRTALGDAGRVVLAVSGGLDSMVLLDAAAATIPPGRLIVGTFDHGTGAAALRACELVERTSATLGIACESDRAVASLAGEAAFRNARWTFLRSVAKREHAVVATAHTADDQLETVLMRVMRDSGARGLAGLYASSDIVRPFVGLTRQALAAYASFRRLEWVEDPSNASSAYLRNRIRHDVLPALRQVQPSIDEELLSTAADAAEWRRTVESFVRTEIRPQVRAAGRGLDVEAESVAAHSVDGLKVLWPALAAHVGLAMDRRGLARLSEFTKSARVGRRMQLSAGWTVVRSREAFELRPRQEAEPTVTELSLSNTTRWGEWSFKRASGNVDDTLWIAWLPADRGLVVRRWRPGDTMSWKRGSDSAGQERGRKVKRFLSDAGVTGNQRPGWPVVLAGDQIVWIPGVRRSAAASDRSGRSGLPFVCEYVNC